MGCVCGKGRGEGGGKGGAYAFVIFEAVLVFVCFLATDDGAVEGFWYAAVCGRVGYACAFLLCADGFGDFAVFAVLAVA